jgi:hypothetical protein
LVWTDLARLLRPARHDAYAPSLTATRLSPAIGLAEQDRGIILTGFSRAPSMHRMTEDTYQPLDLSAYRNAGITLLAADQRSCVGAQVLHGLPFLIGESTRAFVAFGTDLNQTPLVIPIQADAHSVIIAHRLLGSRLLFGGPIAEEVADYVFRLSDGSEHHSSVRERFEISDLATFGQHPLLAVPDGKHGLQDRWAGHWSAAGQRQTEAATGQARAYYLWCWKNPQPGVAIESLEIVPRGPRFLVAGITLGLTDEEPLVRDGAVPVRVDLRQHHLAARPLDGAGSS